MKKIILLFAIFMAADGMLEHSLDKNSEALQAIKDMFIMFDEMIEPINIDYQVSDVETLEEGSSSSMAVGIAEEAGGEEGGQGEGNVDQTKGLDPTVNRQVKRMEKLERENYVLIQQIDEKLDDDSLTFPQRALLLYYKFLLLSYSMMIVQGLHLNWKNYGYKARHTWAYVALMFLHASNNFPLDKAIAAMKKFPNRDGYDVESRMDELKINFIRFENSFSVPWIVECLTTMERKASFMIKDIPIFKFNEEAYTYLKKFFSMLLFKDRVYFHPPPEVNENIQRDLLKNFKKIYGQRADSHRTHISVKLQAIESEIRKSFGIITSKNFDEVPDEKLHLQKKRSVEVFQYLDDKGEKTTPQLYIKDWTDVDFKGEQIIREN